MIKFTNKLIVVFLFYIILCVPISFCYPPNLLASDYESVRAHDFAPGELEVHYLKHGYQFGQITEEQYLQDAQALLDASPEGDVLEEIRPNGDIEHFRVSTGEFAVMTKRGRIRTYFKTSYDYWMRRAVLPALN